jgi:hypothetical protein
MLKFILRDWGIFYFFLFGPFILSLLIIHPQHFNLIYPTTFSCHSFLPPFLSFVPHHT